MTYTGTSLIARHFEGSNIAFADGHVKWYKPEFYSTSGGGLLANVRPRWLAFYQTP